MPNAPKLPKNKKYQALIDHLESLGNGEKDPARRHLGICVELQEFLGGDLWREIKPDIRTVFTLWPKYSGDIKYPVRHSRLSPSEAYGLVDDLWDVSTQYGRDRRELALFLADTIRGPASGLLPANI